MSDIDVSPLLANTWLPTTGPIQTPFVIESDGHERKVGHILKGSDITSMYRTTRQSGDNRWDANINELYKLDFCPPWGFALFDAVGYYTEYFRLIGLPPPDTTVLKRLRQVDTSVANHIMSKMWSAGVVLPTMGLLFRYTILFYLLSKYFISWEHLQLSAQMGGGVWELTEYAWDVSALISMPMYKKRGVSIPGFETGVYMIPLDYSGVREFVLSHTWNPVTASFESLSNPLRHKLIETAINKAVTDSPCSPSDGAGTNTNETVAGLRALGAYVDVPDVRERINLPFEYVDESLAKLTPLWYKHVAMMGISNGRLMQLDDKISNPYLTD